MEIEVRKPREGELEQEGVHDWPIWTCDQSNFDWEYEDREMCYFLEGQATVRTEKGEEALIGPGDLVIFPKGLRCTWSVTVPVRKHYRFG